MHAMLGDAEGMHAGHGLLAAQLHDLHLAHDRVLLDALVEPEQSVGHREHRVVAQLAFDVFADQERGGLPTGQVQRQALDEPLQFHFGRGGQGLAHHGAERIHHDDLGVGGFDLFDDRIQNGAEVFFQNEVAEVDEADRAVHLGLIEELELLLIAQHLDGRLAQHREVEYRVVWAGVGEDDLMRQRGLAATGSAGDDVEGVLGQAAAEDFIEARHAGGQSPNGHSFLSLRAHETASILQGYSANNASGQASPTRRTVRGAPMKVTSSPSRWAMIATAASVAPLLESAASCSNMERSGLTSMLCSAGTSARARARARRSSDVKPSAPANRVRDTWSFSNTRTPSLTCASVALWLAASTASMRRAKSRIDADGMSIIG